MKHMLPLCTLLMLFIVLFGCNPSMRVRADKANGRSPEEYCIKDTVVSPAWVHKLIKYHEAGSTSEAPIGYDYQRSHKYLIFETSWGPLKEAAQYHAGHVPGAIHSNSDIYENGDPRWFLLTDSEIFKAMQAMGITADTTVVVYGADPTFAARLWWILKYAGLEDVKFMDGGYEKWVADGFAGETKVNRPQTAAVPYTGPVKPDVIATVEHVAAHYEDTDQYLLADVRDLKEYEGTETGYDYLLAKGRIPHAIWARPVGGDNDHYFNADNTLKPLDEIAAMWKTFGIVDATPPQEFSKEIIFYCGGGYRSAAAYLYAHLMGYQKIRNLSDGWEGWSTTYTHDLSSDCSDGANGAKHGAWPSDYCQKPSGRPIRP